MGRISSQALFVGVFGFLHVFGKVLRIKLRIQIEHRGAHKKPSTIQCDCWVSEESDENYTLLQEFLIRSSSYLPRLRIHFIIRTLNGQHDRAIEGSCSDFIHFLIAQTAYGFQIIVFDRIDGMFSIDAT